MGWLISDAVHRGKELRSWATLSQLKFMLLIYHQEHGAFPPTKYQPEPGGPIHSWRVLLLPHMWPAAIEHFCEYDFSQEWNSTNNLLAIRRTPYFGYFRMGDDADITNYLAIGDGDEWPSRKPLRSLLITKGEDRFLLVEYPDSEIHWMEPKY
jgi:hypothetical protein